MAEAILQDEVYAVAGAAMEVYYSMGSGFLEAVYHEALSLELANRKIPFENEKQLDLFYKGTKLSKKYVADFVCFGQVIVEVKAIPRLSNIEEAQLLNYLKITKTRVGLLVNFGSRPKLEWKKYVM